MNPIILILVILIFAVVAYELYFKFITIQKDGIRYKVLRANTVINGYARSADERIATLVRINSENMKLLKYLRDNLENYSTDKKIGIKFLLQNYNPEEISERAPTFYDKATSFTEDKKRMSVCLKAKSFNTLFFVNLHELAHMMTKSIGHEDMEFWRNFKFLLEEAKKIGIHIPKKFNNEQYCGMKINSNPYFDL